VGCGWISWRFWTVLVTLAHAFLSVLTASRPRSEPTSPNSDHSRDQTFARLIPLIRNEIRRMFLSLTARLPSLALQLA
jgi:membrane glycosyltransferase